MTSILRLVSDFPPKEKVSIGAYTGLYFLYKKLVEFGVDVHVLTSGYPLHKRYENIDGIHVHRAFGTGTNFLRNKLVVYNIFSSFLIPRLVKKYNIDIVHGHGFDPFLYALNRKLVSSRTPLVFTSHHTVKGWMADIASDFSQSDTGTIRRMVSTVDIRETMLFEKICFNNADLILSVSKAHKEEISTNYGIPQEKIIPVYNGVDTEIFNPSIDGEKIREKYGIGEAPMVLYAGGLGIRKGTKYLIEAARFVCDAIPDAKIMLVGSGGKTYQKYFFNLSERFGLKDNIIFQGTIPFLKLPEYYSACDVFAFPTLHDCFGKALVEAMACEKPVVASNVCGVPEIVEDKVTGFLVKSRDSRELADKILKLIENPKLAKGMGEKGRKRVEKMFTWERAAKENIRIYDKIF